MMSTIVQHTGALTGRHLRFLRREPAYLGFTLAQPMVWLLLFSQAGTSFIEDMGRGSWTATWRRP